MAQIIRNLLEEREALPQEEDMLAVRGSIADWAAIPENYRSAVSACWAGGVLQGRSGGRFDGTESLNRAQACVIWSRLDRLFGGGQDEEGPAPEGPAAEMPAFGLQGDETVQQMMNRINAATPCAAEGCLSFGMAVGDFVFGEQAPVTQRWEGFTLRVGDRSTSRPKARSVFRSSPGWTMKRTPIPPAGSSGTAR